MEHALLRAGVYRFFATAFQYPAERQWRFVNDSTTGTRACLEQLQRATGKFDEFATALARQHHDEVEPTYVQMFINGAPSVIAPPYESLYVADEQRMAAIAAVREFYERCGVDISEDYHDMPDHIAAELEFMYYLCVEQYDAPEHHPIIAAAAREFLADHLLPFAQAMTSALPDGVYHHAARALEEFLTDELSAMVEG